MQYKNIMKRRNEQGRRLKKSERLLKPLKMIAIVGILWSMTGCATKYETGAKIVNNCLDTAESYGDYVECAIQLDEAQY